MRTFTRFAAAASLALAFSGSAHAATIATTPVFSWNLTVTGQDMWCDVVNKRTTPVTLTVETRKEWNGIVDTSGEITLQPDHVFTMKASPGARYCVFDIDGSYKYVEASAVYVDQYVHHYTAYVPAQ